MKKPTAKLTPCKGCPNPSKCKSMGKCMMRGGYKK